jgi:RimJ/RimL family protein N-acetyltransferase
MTVHRTTHPPPDARTDDAPGAACTGWTNADCAGTPYCPPRCPRFYDRAGTPLLVRPLRAEEVDRVVDMYVAIESTALGLPPGTRAGVETWLGRLRERGWNLVAWDGDRAVGHLGVSPTAGDAPEFVVFVRDDYQGRGVGTELVEAAVAYAAAGDYEALSLTVDPANRTAVSVYANVGFAAEGGGVGYEMRLPLDGPVAEAVRRPPAERSADE